MRICLVSHEYPPDTADGGIGTQTWNKAHGLTQLGHTVEVFSCAGRGSDLPVTTRMESGVRVHRICPPGHAPKNSVPIYDQSAYLLGYTWSVLDAVSRRLAKEPFDLINFPEYGGEGCAFLTNRTVHNWTPVIVQLHAPTAMLAERMGWPDKTSAYYRTAAFLESESIRLADGWMASSANIADFAAEHYTIPRSAIDVVHCGLDCDLFCPPTAGPRDDHRPTVLFVGNIAESKGLTTVFDAVLQLRERFPQLKLQVVGKPNELWQRIVARAEKMGADYHLEHIPYVRERDQIVRLFQEAHVVASPADHENGVANVYVEAMACGCPVIAANTGGAPEAVDNGRTGLLVPPRDVTATAQALERMLGDGPFRRRLGQAARRRAVEYFAREKYLERVLAAYHRTRERSSENQQRLQALG